MATVQPMWGEVFAMPPATTAEDLTHLPDLAILRTATPPSWTSIAQDPPLLAVEVISESQTLAEPTLKAQVHRRAGVEEVWVVDHRTRVVEIWNAQGQASLPDTRDLTSSLLPGFSMPVRYLLDG